MCVFPYFAFINVFSSYYNLIFKTSHCVRGPLIGDVTDDAFFVSVDICVFIFLLSMILL